MKKAFRFGCLLSTLFVLIAVSGCSTMHYSAQNTPMINLKGCEDATESFEYTMTGNFFLCGLTPGELDVDLTRIAQENGAANGLCNVAIEEKVTFINGLLGACTVGIYVPRTITITAQKIGD